jgi:hypothetical protein
MEVIGWSSSEIVSGSHALPPKWLQQCSCIVIESSFDPGERLQAPGSLWFHFTIKRIFFIFEPRRDYHSEMNSVIFNKWVELLVPTLPPKSLIVMDNVSYHSVIKEGTKAREFFGHLKG